MRSEAPFPMDASDVGPREDCRVSSETAMSALSGVPLEAEQRPQRTLAATVRPTRASAGARRGHALGASCTRRAGDRLQPLT
jgi:hypothetical protein